MRILALTLTLFTLAVFIGMSGIDEVAVGQEVDPNKLNEYDRRTDLGNGQFQIERTMGPRYFKDTDGAYRDIELSFEDKGTYWEARKGVYILRVSKEFTPVGTPVIQFISNLEDKKHQLEYTPSSVMWVNKNNPTDTQVVTSARSVTGTLASATAIRFQDAFGPNTAFEVHLTKTGFQKYIVLDAKPNIAPRTADDVLVFFTEYTGNVARFLYNEGEWDKQSYVVVDDAVTIEDQDGNKMRILPAIIEDLGATASGTEPVRQIKQVFTTRNQKLFQGKILPLNFLNNAVYPVRADATVDGTVDIDQWLDGNAATTNRNNVADIRIGNQGGTDRARGIVRWTMPSHPGGSVQIDKIEVSLYFNNSGNGGLLSPDISAWYGSNTAATTWSETTSTWNVYSTGNNWAAAGGLSDFTVEADELIDLDDETDGVFHTWTVQGTGALNDINVTWGDPVNLLFQETDGVGEQMNYQDRPDANPPKITVTYSDAPAGEEEDPVYRQTIFEADTIYSNIKLGG